MKADTIIIGGGVAGLSAAYYLSQLGRVVLLEAEQFFGMHSSGRSSEQFTVGITAPTMRALAQASRSFFVCPPRGFIADKITSARGCLTVGRSEQRDHLEALLQRIHSVGAGADLVAADVALELFPALRPKFIDAGVFEPGAMDIDSALLLERYARGARENGAQLLTKMRADSIDRGPGYWDVRSGNERFMAPILVNAAGAWADRVASLAGEAPIGLRAFRRTAFTFRPPESQTSKNWPHVSNVDYQWYVQPGAVMTGSLAEAIETAAGDVYPNDEDVALAIYNIERDTTLQISKPLSSWAGLRSFVRDRNPVCGTRAGAEGFYWLAGQGGCGILTSPALGQAIAALVRGTDLPAGQISLGITTSNLSPERLDSGPNNSNA